MGARRAGWLLAALVLVVLSACGGPDPEEAAEELAAMKVSVDAEVRDMADLLAAAGLTVERATGHVERGGMSTYASEDYSAAALLVADGEEADQVDTAATALERAGWERTADGLDAQDPWAQLEREDFRATIGWTQHGPRELWLELDQAGEVEVPTDAPVVDRDNALDIPLK